MKLDEFIDKLLEAKDKKCCPECGKKLKKGEKCCKEDEAENEKE